MAEKQVHHDDIDDEKCIAMARKMIKDAHVHPIPPAEFKPLLASNAELVKYGFPPRPSHQTQPKLRALWEEILSRPLRVVPPGLAVSGGPPRRISKRSIKTSGSGSTSDFPTWSGAVVVRAEEVEPITSISASWTIPNAWPPSWAWNGTRYNSGHWRCATWVGFDGFNNFTKDDVIQAGTFSEVWVDDRGNITQNATPWIQWYPAASMSFRNLTVKPGDTVFCSVCRSDSSDLIAKTYMANMSSGESSSAQFSPNDSEYRFVGRTAEWIQEDTETNFVPDPFPSYGSIFFYNCVAAGSTTDYDLSNVTTDDVLDMVPAGLTVSRAKIVTPQVLQTMYATVT